MIASLPPELPQKAKRRRFTRPQKAILVIALLFFVFTICLQFTRNAAHYTGPVLLINTAISTVEWFSLTPLGVISSVCLLVLLFQFREQDERDFSNENPAKRKPPTPKLYALSLAFFDLFALFSMFAPIFVVPVFADMFADLGCKLPPATQLCIDFSRSVRGSGGSMIIYGLLCLGSITAVSCIPALKKRRLALFALPALAALVLLILVVVMFLPVFAPGPVMGGA